MSIQVINFAEWKPTFKSLISVICILINKDNTKYINAITENGMRTLVTDNN